MAEGTLPLESSHMIPIPQALVIWLVYPDNNSRQPAIIYKVPPEPALEGLQISFLEYIV